MASNRRLKAFVRYDGSGRVIPGSLNLQASKPKVGNWKEIDAYLCCNNVLPSNCIQFIVNTTDGIFFGMNVRSLVQDYAYTVNWGDGTSGQGSSGEGYVELLHDFPQVGSTYTVRLCFSDPLVINELEFYGND